MILRFSTAPNQFPFRGSRVVFAQNFLVCEIFARILFVVKCLLSMVCDKHFE